MNVLVAAGIAFALGAAIAAAVVLAIRGKLGLTAAAACGLISATIIGGLATAFIASDTSPQIWVLVACGIALVAFAASPLMKSTPAVYLAATLAGLAMCLSGSALPVFDSFALNVITTTVLFAPLVLMCTNLEGTPGEQVTVLPIMAIGASIIGMIRGDHALGHIGLAAGGACLGVAAWCWLGRGNRLHPTASLFLGFVVIAVGTGFEGKHGLSVLAIGIGLLVIPVTDFFVIAESRRRAGKLYWGYGEDHLYHRIRARGLSKTHANVIIMGAAAVGVTASCLTAGGIIIWPVGLVIAWTMKLSLTYWALRAPLPGDALAAH